MAAALPTAVAAGATSTAAEVVVPLRAGLEERIRA
jgi:hypothetical protein